MLKVLLITPNFHQTRGNTITVRRISEGLQSLGIETEIISSTDENLKHRPSADIVHGFHAFHFREFMNKHNLHYDKYVVTLTGTDLNQYLYNEDTKMIVLSTLEKSKAIHVFNEEAKQTLIDNAPTLGEKIYVISQGVEQSTPSTSHFKKDENSFLFVLPAGIRKIKNVPSAIHMLKKLRNRYPMVRLWIIGPVLEETEGRKVKQLVNENSDWVEYKGEVPHEEMSEIYIHADVLLNTSISEGQSSAILEGMGHGLPVLVANNDGNRSIVKHQQTGLVYSTESEFLDYAQQIMNNNKLRNTIRQTAKDYIANHHSHTNEANMLLKMYRDAL
ncbi:glycosyltransferase family 4 protein [Salirhabdus salicampi]|uniref:glycosyltransferase family 4 protein n=1 Tax=Salirhabdus salicampi TaxID=476102 RepID=UPI0020C3B979|nr:glycosyltransferase family 4 protein [Salirhabdus salicampi]MCP8616230.1 glycosyltransferase family 4 protein [Salirhabdus salicampi]